MNIFGAVKGFIIGLIIGGFMGYFIYSKIGADFDSLTSGIVLIIFPLLLGIYGAIEGNKMR